MFQSPNNRVEGSFKKLLPLGMRLVVKPSETPEYKGTIILPDSIKTVIPTTGTVMALGFDFPEDYPLHEGDQVVFSKFGGVELKWDDGHRLVILHIDDVLAITRSVSEMIRGGNGSEAR